MVCLGAQEAKISASFDTVVFPSGMSSPKEARPEGSDGPVKECGGIGRKRFSDDGERKMRESHC